MWWYKDEGFVTKFCTTLSWVIEPPRWYVLAPQTVYPGHANWWRRGVTRYSFDFSLFWLGALGAMPALISYWRRRSSTIGGGFPVVPNIGGNANET